MNNCSFLFTTKNPIKIISFLQYNFKNYAAAYYTAPQALENGSTHVKEHFNFVDLHPQIQRYAHSGHIKKAVQDLYVISSNSCQTPTVYDLNALLNCSLRSNNVEYNDLFEVFDGMKKVGPCPNALTYNFIVKGMISLGRLEDGILLMEEMCGRGFVPSFSVLSRFFKRARELGSLLDCLRSLAMMFRLGYSPEEDSLNEMIFALSKGRFIREAYALYRVVLEKGCFGDAYDYNPIVWALCKSKQSYLALGFICSAKKKGCRPDVCSYTALVYGFCQQGLWDEALSCLRGMEADGCDPNVITYSIMIKFLCDDGKVDEAFKLLGAMEFKGYTENMAVDNILQHESSEKDNVIEVEDIRIIDRKGYSPFQYKHVTLVGGKLTSGKVEISNKFLLDIIYRGGLINDLVYYVYCQSLSCHNKSIEAFLEKIGLSPTNVSYNIILEGLWMDFFIHEMLEFVDHIDWASGGIDIIAFNTILSAACKQGNFAMIRRIMYRMEHEGIKIDIIGYTGMVQYFCQVKKLRECLQLLGSMIIRGHIPSIVTFNTLIDEVCKGRLLGTAGQIFKYIKSCGIIPDVTTYNALLRASLRDGNYSMVDQLSRDMYSQNLKPDVVTYECLILGLCREGKISDACELRHQMIEHGFTPNTGIYNTILEAMLKKDQFWEIIQLVKNMKVDGCEPNDDSRLILTRAISEGSMKSYAGAGKLLLKVMNG